LRDYDKLTIITFINWDVVGLISYLLINFWSSKTNGGIKAVLYNKVGDCFFLFLLSFSFSFFSFINFLPFSLICDLLLSFLSSSSLSFLSLSSISLSFLFIFFSKSAQLPFSSWLLNAMSAPTPISALLHSSTMVIAGVYLGLIIDFSFDDQSALIPLSVFLSFIFYWLFIYAFFIGFNEWSTPW